MPLSLVYCCYRYSGDSQQKVQRAAKTLLRVDDAKAHLKGIATQKNLRAVADFEIKFGKSWNLELNKQITRAEQIQEENMRLNMHAKSLSCQLLGLQDQVMLAQATAMC